MRSGKINADLRALGDIYRCGLGGMMGTEPGCHDLRSDGPEEVEQICCVVLSWKV